MRYCSEDAPRARERNVNLNKNASKNAALNKMSVPRRIFHQIAVKIFFFGLHLNFEQAFHQIAAAFQMRSVKTTKAFLHAIVYSLSAACIQY